MRAHKRSSVSGTACLPIAKRKGTFKASTARIRNLKPTAPRKRRNRSRFSRLSPPHVKNLPVNNVGLPTFYDLLFGSGQPRSPTRSAIESSSSWNFRSFFGGAFSYCSGGVGEGFICGELGGCAGFWVPFVPMVEGPVVPPGCALLTLTPGFGGI